MVMLLIEQELDCINACLLKGVGIYFSQFASSRCASIAFSSASASAKTFFSCHKAAMIPITSYGANFEAVF